MNDQELITLLRSTRTSRESRYCPVENQFVAYIHKQLSERQRQELEMHFAECGTCLEALSFLVKAEDALPETVPAALLVSARSIAEPKRSFVWRWRWAFATATACVLILVFLGVWRLRSSHDNVPQQLVASNIEPTRTPISVPSPSLQKPVVQSPKAPEVRTPAVRGSSDTLKPVLLLPRNGGTLSGEQPAIRWKPMADANLYEVNVVTTDGGHVFTQSTTGTQLTMHDQPLQPGKKYFVTVTAHLSGNRTVRSDLVSFHVTGKP